MIEAGPVPAHPDDPSSGRVGRDEPGIFELLVTATVDYAIFALDVNGLVLTWNQGAERLKGYAAEEIIGGHFSCFYPPEDVAAGKPDQDLAVAVADGHFEDEGWRLRKDGTPFWANVVVTALRGDDGRLLGFGKVTRDLTERKRGEDALRDSEERFRLLVGGVRDYAIFLLEPDGTVASWNEGAERLKGYRADEILGRSFATFYTEADLRDHVPQKGLEQARTTGRWESEGWRIRKDGSRFWANIVITALYGGDGRHRGFAKVTRDLTDRKRGEDALRGVLAREREATAQLRELDRMRGELVAVVAHDLRAPVTLVQHLVQLLRRDWDTSTDDDRLASLDRVASRLQTLGSLVDDLFDVARIDAGQVKVDATAIDVATIAEQVAVDAGTTHPGRIVRLRVDRGARALGDERRTWQVLSNLLSNALKFSHSDSEVGITVERTDETITVCVADNGVGIPEDEQEAAFERFTRLSGATDTPGSGIGLFIARSLVEEQGGAIWVESTPGAGSSFRFTLPAAS